MTFEEVCSRVETSMENLWKAADETDRMMRLEREKRAIMGFEEEMEEYRRDIRQIICDGGMEQGECPPWYKKERKQK